MTDPEIEFLHKIQEKRRNAIAKSDRKEIRRFNNNKSAILVFVIILVAAWSFIMYVLFSVTIQGDTYSYYYTTSNNRVENLYNTTNQIIGGTPMTCIKSQKGITCYE